MPCEGFRCSDGRLVKFEDCFRSCEKRCMELALLVGAASERETRPWEYHVTEIIQPPQKIWLSHHVPYYVEPKNQVNLMMGTAIHDYIEKQHSKMKGMGMGDDYVSEGGFSLPLEVNGVDVTLVGRIDQIQKSTATIADFKTIKKGEWMFRRKPGYDVKAKDHYYQLNIYNWAKQMRAKSLKRVVIIKDRTVTDRDFSEVENDPVPIMPNIGDWVMARLGEIVENELDPKTVRPCTHAETWGGTRCRYYCAVSDDCPQYSKKVLDFTRFPPYSLIGITKEKGTGPV